MTEPTDRPFRPDVRPTDRQIDESLAQIHAEAREEVRDEVRHEFWGITWPRRVVPVVAGIALVVSVGVGALLAPLYDRQGATDTALTVLRDQAQQAKASGDQANAQLQARGQAGVPIPQPGQAPDLDVIVSAATARVLASLPDTRPSAADLGAAVARYIAANPIVPPGPTPLQISSALAAYLATSPPPSGPAGETGEPGTAGQPGQPGASGEKGEKGDPPTTQEIQDAFAAYLREHPDALCPSGGSFAQLRVVLADGGTADTYTCVVTTYPTTEPTSPPSSTEPLPIPTTGG